MLSVLAFLLVLTVLGISFGVFRISSYHENGHLVHGKVIKAAFVLILAIVGGFVNPIEVQRIDAGNVGVKIDRVGNNKGVPIAIPVKGWVFYNSWVSDIKEYSIGQNHVDCEAFTVTCKGGFPVTVKPSYNYALKPDKAADLYINLLKGNDFSSLKDTWLKTAHQLALSNATNAYAIDSMFNHKQHYNEDVAREMNKEMSKYFEVSQINPGVTPPQELADVIRNKTEAIQKAQQAELDKITADANAQTKMANARGDSAEKVINALADAEVIRLKTKELSGSYVEYIKWKDASPNLPRVPSTMLGSSTSVLYSPK